MHCVITITPFHFGPLFKLVCATILSAYEKIKQKENPNQTKPKTLKDVIPKVKLTFLSGCV